MKQSFGFPTGKIQAFPKNHSINSYFFLSCGHLFLLEQRALGLATSYHSNLPRAEWNSSALSPLISPPMCCCSSGTTLIFRAQFPTEQRPVPLEKKCKTHLDVLLFFPNCVKPKARVTTASWNSHNHRAIKAGNPLRDHQIQPETHSTAKATINPVPKCHSHAFLNSWKFLVMPRTLLGVGQFPAGIPGITTALLFLIRDLSATSCAQLIAGIKFPCFSQPVHEPDLTPLTQYRAVGEGNSFKKVVGKEREVWFFSSLFSQRSSLLQLSLLPTGGHVPQSKLEFSSNPTPPRDLIDWLDFIDLIDWLDFTKGRFWQKNSPLMKANSL